MKNDKFFEVEKILCNKRSINQGIIDDLEEEIDLNSVESRNFNSTILTFTVHIVFLILLFILQKVLKIPTPLIELLSSVIPICSVGTGISIELISNNIKQQKIKVLDFYSNMREHKIIEEIVILRIEKELFQARNSSIDKALELEKEYQNLVTNVFNSNQTKSFCSIDVYGIEDLENDIKLYDNYFEEKYDRLKKLITKKIIIEKFNLNKSMVAKVFDLLFSSAINSIIPLMLYGSLGYLFNIQFNLPYLMPISFLLNLIYKLKIKKDEHQSFQELVSDLKCELPSNINSSYVDKLNLEIEDIITCVSNNLIEFTKENILLNEKKKANLEKEKEDKVFKQYLNTKDSSLEDILSNSLVVSTIDEEIIGPKLIKKR